MRKIRWITVAVLSISIAAVMFTGCSSDGQVNEALPEDNQTVAEENNDDLYITGKTEIHYTKRDLSGEYENGTEVKLDGSYTISEEGTYIFSGSVKDGQILVEADEQAKVQIVLKGVDLTCSDGPAIYVKSADKVFLTLADGTENYLSDGTIYQTTEDEPWGAVFSKDDLTINGSGSLAVSGKYLHGIVSKDSLKITGGKIEVTAVEDGIRGRDEVCIHDGKIHITAGEDGIKSNNDEEEGKGNVTIDGGTVSISGTASQGIDGYNVVQILGGQVSIDTENEGLQGEYIYIADGSITIDAVDDCLNAKDSLIDDSEALHEDAMLEIAGGNLNLSTSAGDGLDSNGNLSVSGGRTIVQGSAGGVEVAMDYNGTGSITGGTVLAVGASGMAQNFDNSSSQCSLMYGCSGNEGAVITLKDASGNELESFETEKGFSSVIISTPDMKTGNTYVLDVNGIETNIEMTQTIMSYGGMGMGGGPGMHGGGNPGMMPGHMPGNMPDGRSPM